VKKRKRQPRQKPYRERRYTLFDEMAADPVDPLPQAWRTYQLTRMYAGLSNLEQADNPTPDDWRVVSDAVNLVETLVLEMKVCQDDSGLLMDAITALAMAGKRSKEGKTLRLDGAGIQAVRSILRDYSELLDVLPARTMVRCHRMTEKRIQDMLDGKRRPHDVEICDL
jgi:hypothetical protein